MAEAWTPSDTSTFIVRFGEDGPAVGVPGLRVPGLPIAVKDLIDMAGVVTTAGSRAVAEKAAPAMVDAACLSGIRAAEAAGRVRIVGKTNLNELAYGVTGSNPWFGDPTNPIDPGRVVGGSSSGSAVAVATGAAHVALGSDTGGSIRIPAACCGVAGLKTTRDRVPSAGVWALAPSLDTIGPMAADVAGVVVGMRLLEPGFAPGGSPAPQIGRVVLPADVAVDAAVDDAVDRALAESGIAVVPRPLPGWSRVTDAGMVLLAYEAWEVDGALARAGGLSAQVAARLEAGARLQPAQAEEAGQVGRRWADGELRAALAGGAVLALPTLRTLPPRLDDAASMTHRRLTMPANLAGVPALALPIPTTGGFPASLQLIGPPGGEELLVATAAVIEAAIGD